MGIMNFAGLWFFAYNYCKDNGVTDEEIEWWRNFPKPHEIKEEIFLAELAWCIYNSGMKEAVVRSKWPKLENAFMGFYPNLVVKHKEKCLDKALAVFNHRAKAEAVIAGAEKIMEDMPLVDKLAPMSEDEVLQYFESYRFIGKITRYHLARNVGYDVVKPDRHLVRLAKFCGFEDPIELVESISKATGERKMFIDYILWRWLSWHGPEAYKFTECYRDL